MSVASKNLYDLLGNDVEESDIPKAPLKPVDKTSTHTAKRNTDGLAPATKAPAQTTRRTGNVSGNEAAFRDRNAGSDRNRGKPTEDAPRGGSRGGRDARVRGGRGARNPRGGDDRHSKSLPTGGSDKQAAQSWGATEGKAELKDEQAGEEIAKSEEKEAAAEAAEEVKEEEPEDKHISYSDYLAQLAEKKLALEAEAALNVRKANEGSKEDKKWAAAKALAKEEGEEFITAAGGKAQRQRERKTKQFVELENRYIEPERPTRGGRGGRGGARGDSAPRGRGGRGSGAPRGTGAPRAEFRGARGGAQKENKLNPSDESAFPSLGA